MIVGKQEPTTWKACMKWPSSLETKWRKQKYKAVLNILYRGPQRHWYSEAQRHSNHLVISWILHYLELFFLFPCSCERAEHNLQWRKYHRLAWSLLPTLPLENVQWRQFQWRQSSACVVIVTVLDLWIPASHCIRDGSFHSVHPFPTPSFPWNAFSKSVCRFGMVHITFSGLLICPFLGRFRQLGVILHWWRAM